MTPAPGMSRGTQTRLSPLLLSTPATQSRISARVVVEVSSTCSQDPLQVLVLGPQRRLLAERVTEGAPLPPQLPSRPSGQRPVQASCFPLEEHGPVAYGTTTAPT